MLVKSFRDLMNGRESAEVRCLYTGNLVRRLRLTECRTAVEIDASAPGMKALLVRVPLDTPITYRPWVFDRGNMLFDGSATGLDVFAGETLKICGEGDLITFEGGGTSSVMPGRD